MKYAPWFLSLRRAKSEWSTPRSGPTGGAGGGGWLGRGCTLLGPALPELGATLPSRQPGPLPACGSSAGPGTSSPRHLIKLTMCCYLHADLPGFLSSCSEPWSFCALTARQSLNAIFVRPRCALIEDAFVPSRFPLCSIYKALL